MPTLIETFTTHKEHKMGKQIRILTTVYYLYDDNTFRTQKHKATFKRLENDRIGVYEVKTKIGEVI